MHPLPLVTDFHDEESNVLLTFTQVQEIEEFRRELQTCPSDGGKFRECLAKRDSLLGKRTELELFVASVEAVMASECKQYTKHKEARFSGKEFPKEESELWNRFLGIAQVGVKTGTNCLPALRKVA